MNSYKNLVKQAQSSDKPCNIKANSTEILFLCEHLINLQKASFEFVDGYTAYDLSNQLGLPEESCKTIFKHSHFKVSDIFGFDSLVRAAKNGTTVNVSADLILEIYESVNTMKDTLKTLIDDDHVYDLSVRIGLSEDVCQSFLDLVHN